MLKGRRGKPVSPMTQKRVLAMSRTSACLLAQHIIPKLVSNKIYKINEDKPSDVQLALRQ